MVLVANFDDANDVLAFSMSRKTIKRYYFRLSNLIILWLGYHTILW